MQTKLAKGIGACLAAATLVASVPAAAQSSGGTPGGGTYTTETRQDNNRDWGWIGLLGLLGLLALRRKNEDRTVRRDNLGRP